MSAIDWLDDGRTEIHLANGRTITLGLPDLGQFKAWRLEWQRQVDDLDRRTREIRERHGLRLVNTGEGRQRLAGGDADAIGAYHDEIRQLQDEADKRLEDWWADVCEQLGTEPLPENRDEWPAALIYGENVVVRTFDHWRHVP